MKKISNSYLFISVFVSFLTIYLFACVTITEVDAIIPEHETKMVFYSFLSTNDTVINFGISKSYSYDKLLKNEADLKINNVEFDLKIDNVSQKVTPHPTNPLIYQTQQILKPHQSIEVTLKSPQEFPNITLYAKTVMPTAPEKIEIDQYLGLEDLFLEGPLEGSSTRDYYFVFINTIIDIPNENNYYIVYPKYYQKLIDCPTNSSPSDCILNDGTNESIEYPIIRSISSNFESIELGKRSYLLFNDSFFKNSKHSFKSYIKVPSFFTARKKNHLEYYNIIEFHYQSITKETYDYLLTAFKQVYTDEEVIFGFTPLQVKGNVENGLGVLGAVSEKESNPYIIE